VRLLRATRARSTVWPGRSVLGIGIANIVTVLTPDRVVVGGGVAAAGDILFSSVRAELERRVRMTGTGSVELVRAELGLGGAIGAAIHGAEAGTGPGTSMIEEETGPMGDGGIVRGRLVLEDASWRAAWSWRTAGSRGSRPIRPPRTAVGPAGLRGRPRTRLGRVQRDGPGVVPRRHGARAPAPRRHVVPAHRRHRAARRAAQVRRHGARLDARRGGGWSGALGFNLEGPFVSPSASAHRTRVRAGPRGRRVRRSRAPRRRLPAHDDRARGTGALELIRWLAERGVVASLGHSVATAAEAHAGYDAGALTTTHLFNAMSGIHQHTPGLAAVALGRDDVYTELIADGHHVDRELWPLILRTKPRTGSSSRATG